jgi:predicted Zn-dependent peptidase
VVRLRTDLKTAFGDESLMAEIERRSVCDGVWFRSIRDSRFKTVRISIHFFRPLERDTVSENAILPFLLTRASRQYPDYTKLNEHLAELYGAELDADVQKLGDLQVLSISITGLADRYALCGEKLSSEYSRLLCSLLFDPLLVDGMFPEDGFEQEKRQMSETLDAEFNDKRLYALRRCEEIMCSGEPYGIGRYGTKKDIQAIKRENLTQVWQSMIHSAQAEIIVLGDCDPEPVFKDFSDAFLNVGRAFKVVPCSKVIKTVDCPKEETETTDVAQSKLVMGFRAGCAEPDKMVPAMKLMSALYGGTPNSKLFLNVREKMSLCYYCSSMFNPMKGLLMVQSGVENTNIERAKNEILKQLEEVKKNNFTDDDLQAAKLSLCNSYHTVADSLDSLEGWYLSKTFSDPSRTPEQEAAMITAVTREELVEAANKVVLDTVYRLTGIEAKQ